jgi:hypothetical protein
VAAIALSIFAIKVAIDAQQQTVALESNLRAREDWGNYMKLAMETPEFSAGVDLQKLDEIGRKRYEWFVSSMLFSSESVLESDESSLWIPGIKRQLHSHSDLICSPDFRAGELKDYSTKLVQLVESFCQREAPDA